MASIPRNAAMQAKASKTAKKGTVILKAAQRVFAGKGFHAATISDIAKKAKVSEGTIYEYFSSKEELLFSIPAETIQQYLDKNLEILQHIQGAANKLRFLIHRHLSLYADNPDYANVVMLILKGNRNFLKTSAYQIVRSSARTTIEVIEEGIRNGEFRCDIQPYLIRAMIWGTIEHLVTRKSLLGEPEDLPALADEVVNIVFQGILAPRNDPAITVNVRVRKD